MALRVDELSSKLNKSRPFFEFYFEVNLFDASITEFLSMISKELGNAQKREVVNIQTRSHRTRVRPIDTVGYWAKVP